MTFFIAMIDHRRQRGGRFTAAGRPDHQDQAAAQHDQFLHLLGHTEFVESRQFRSNVAQYHCNVAALLKDIETEAPESGLRNREVHLEFPREFFEQIFAHQFDRRLSDHLGRHFELVDRHDIAVDLYFGRCEKKSEAFLSTINLNSGLTFICRAVPWRPSKPEQDPHS